MLGKLMAEDVCFLCIGNSDGALMLEVGYRRLRTIQFTKAFDFSPPGVRSLA